MKLFAWLSAAIAAAPIGTSAQAVFAHVIVGNTASYSVATWQSDINLARAASIDGFVLNVGTPLAGTTASQIANAFQAAANLNNGFKLFFSFDYLGGADGAWAASDVEKVLKQYGSMAQHFKVGKAPLVSTFEGTGNINDWPGIRSVVGGIHFIPDWTSLGSSGFKSHLGVVDGAFNWNMWPAGATDITDSDDLGWKSAIAGKDYMMGVSPWFFTDLPGYGKAWVWRGDDMWHTRWEQVLQVKPAFVEIVTWNDYGESHYVGPIRQGGIPSNSGAGEDATWYVDGMPHDAWREVLPYYISAYKTKASSLNGDSAPDVTTEKLIYWYRLSPGAAGSNNGVTGNNCPSPLNKYPYQDCVDPNAVVEDKIFVTAVVKKPSTIKIQVGHSGPTQTFAATSKGAWHFNWKFNSSMTGHNITFSIQRGSQTVLSESGYAIKASPPNGITNYNAWVGGLSA